MKIFMIFLKKLLVIFTILSIITIFSIYLISINNDITVQDTISSLKKNIADTINFYNNSSLIDNSSLNISNNSNYYYTQLDDTSKIIYTFLENNINNLKKENYIIDFSTTFNDLLNKSAGKYKLNKAFQSALDAFFYDHPEIFYIDVSKITLTVKSSTILNKTTYRVEIVPSDNKNYLLNTFESEEEVDIAISQIENIKNNIITKIFNKNIYTQILNAHDTLASHIEYDSNSNKENAHNIYGALIEKKAVCEGYAKAFKYILDNLNVECILVSGNATNSSNKTESHMWNYVKLNNSWYGVDLTWDDPIIIGGSSKNNIRHSYFLKGLDSFINSHYSTGKLTDSGMMFSLPQLSYDNYNKK